MTSQAVSDFLTKQLVIENNIVTYRSLSRALVIHVNEAKNELAAYLANPQSRPPAATYLLSGEVHAARTRFNEETSMDVDMDYDGDVNMNSDEGDDGEDVPKTEIILVGEQDLERAKSKFRRLYSICVYSLSPAPIRDSGLLCGPTESVREIDNSKKGPEIAIIVGKVIGEHVQMKASSLQKNIRMAPPIASTSKLPPNIKSGTSPEKGKVEEKEKAKEKDKQKNREEPKVVVDKPKEKPKATGKLDFSKAKTKDMKKEEAKVEQKKKALTKSASTPIIKSEEVEANKEEPKRGIKRKSISTLMSDSDDANASSSSTRSKPLPKTKPGPRIKKGVVLSDDEDEVPQSTRRKGKLTPGISSDVDSDAERDLKAMMDVDDDEVVRASTAARDALKEEEEEEEEEEKEETEAKEDDDVDMADEVDVAPKSKPKKRKPKKVIPLGRNGLKKKRIVKSRTTIDDKGYMATEDYSSYESVDEEEPEPAAPAKAKGKAKSTSTKRSAEDSDSAVAAPSKTKLTAKGSFSKAPPPRGGAKTGKSSGASSKAGGQKSLANFFGPTVVKAKK